MITTSDALNSCLAHRAEGDIFPMAIAHLVSFFHVILTAISRMVLIFALKADFCLADVTCDILDFIVCCNHCSVTMRLNTVTQERIRCLLLSRAPLT